MLKAVIDALSFELPKAVARFACVSRRCLEIAERVIDRFIEICSPRDMISILCEVYYLFVLANWIREMLGILHLNTA